MSHDATSEPAIETLVETRLAWQAVAEHVLSAALYAATGHIGLRAAPGGIATPAFPGSAGETTVAIEGRDIVVRDDEGERRATLTTLRAAGELVGVTPGSPRDVYTPATPLELDRALPIDGGAAGVLADWYALVDRALAQLRAELAGDDPSIVQLWPEHFDMATTIAEVNYGGSPGDAVHPAPYLYVGPFDPPAPDDPTHGTGYWNESFGASRGQDTIDRVSAALAFFREGRSRLAS